MGKPSMHCVRGDGLQKWPGRLGKTSWFSGLFTRDLPTAGGRREMEKENQIPDPEKQKQAAQFGEDGGRIGNLWDSQGFDPSSI